MEVLISLIVEGIASTGEIRRDRSDEESDGDQSGMAARMADWGRAETGTLSSRDKVSVVHEICSIGGVSRDSFIEDEIQEVAEGREQVYDRLH